MIGEIYKYVNPYHYSFIYEIYDKSNPEHRYIGSTKNTLNSRLIDHKTLSKQYLDGNLSKYCTSHEIIKNNNYDIRILNTISVNNKNELHNLEGFYQRTMNCVNRHIEGRTKKQYYQDNKLKYKLRYQNNKLCK